MTPRLSVAPGRPLRLALAALSFATSSLLAQTAPAPSSAEAEAFYRDKVHPLLKQHCVKCHGGEKIKGGLVLTSRQALLKGGENGSSIDPSNPAKSLLLDMMSYRDGDHEMPPAGKRPPEELEILRQWIALGAPFDPALEAKPVQTADAHPAPPSAKDGAQWWAYQPVKPPTLPAAPQNGPTPNPVDVLLSQSLAKAGLHPNGRAPKAQLIRRAFYDLTGLPPSPAEVERFVADPAPDAFARLVDSLLAKPQYGEKWARHWMDLVRYAESEGFERDSDKEHIWRYRDYLIEAFNKDLPYNQFLTEQLAGDELPKPTRESLTATGFLRLMQYDDEPADRLLAKYDLLADNVLVTAETFLGMSLGCARCHDHKKDPLSQKDYYSFMAFFHGMRDYGATRHQPVMWVAEEERARLAQERRQQIEALDREYHPRAQALLDWLAAKPAPAAKPPTPAADPVLVRPQAGPENAWRHTAADPGPHWRAENFNAEPWSIASETPAKAGQPIWMRARFGLSEVPAKFGLEIHYAGDTEVFLNGSSVFRAPNLPPGKRFLDLSKLPKLKNALHTGSNVLAIRTSLTRDGALPAISFYQGESPIQTAARLLNGPKAPELKAALLALKPCDSVPWLELVEKPLGTPLSAVSENGATPEPLAIHKRGSPQNLGDPVVPAYPAVLSAATAPVPAQIVPRGKTSSGRRLALAEWMVRPENPLVSRVLVNRLWQHHFGRGIVPSSNEFGRLGETPSHPELLDYLAHRFVQNGWSLKAMHRLLMNSEAYQRSSTASPESLAKDPDNRLLWRYPMRRLTAEELRDSLLTASGTLRLDPFGPPVYPPLPAAVLETQSRPGAGWPKQTSEQSARRSVYVHVKRSLSVPLLSNHDQATTDSPCAMRFTSTVPTQALGMLNSEFMEEQASLFAKRLQREAGDTPEAQIRRGLQLAFQRPPAPKEIALCLTTLRKFQTELQLPPQEALQRVALLLLNSNEFLYLD
jgi:hypothetical protein